MLWQTTTRTVVNNRATSVAWTTKIAEPEVLKAAASNKPATAVVATRIAAKTREEPTSKDKAVVATLEEETKETGKQQDTPGSRRAYLFLKWLYKNSKGPQHWLRAFGLYGVLPKTVTCFCFFRFARCG